MTFLSLVRELLTDGLLPTTFHYFLPASFRVIMLQFLSLQGWACHFFLFSFPTYEPAFSTTWPCVHGVPATLPVF